MFRHRKVGAKRPQLLAVREVKRTRLDRHARIQVPDRRDRSFDSGFIVNGDNDKLRMSRASRLQDAPLCSRPHKRYETRERVRL